MALNNAGLVLLATTLQTNLAYAQLHSGLAGPAGTDNIAGSGRQPVLWGTIDPDGDFGLASSSDFTGGPSLGPVFSVTLWNLPTGGTFWGEFPLGGDAAFNGAGQFSVTVIDVTGTSAD